MSQQEYTHYHRIFSEDRNLSSFPLHAETIDSIQHDNLSASQLNTCKSINTAESEIMADPINPTKFKPWKKKDPQKGRIPGNQKWRVHRRGVIQARALDVVIIKTLGGPV